LCFVLAGPVSASAATLEDARKAYTAGEAGAAESTLKTLLKQDPGNIAARLLLADVHLDALQPTAARMQLEHATAAGADRSKTLLPAVRAHVMLGEYEQALVQLAASRSLGAPLDAAQVKALEGDALNGLDRDEEAAAAYEAALEQDARNLAALLGSARLSAEAGALPKARTLLSAALEVHPTSWQAWDLLGRIEQTAGHAERAEAAFTQAIAAAPENWYLYYQRGVTRVALGNLDGAEADRDALANALPDLPRLGFLNGRLALAQNDLKRAQAELSGQVEAWPDDIEARYWLAEAMARDGQYISAKNVLIPALASAPGSVTLTMLLARCHLGLDEYSEADSLLRPLAQHYPAARALLAAAHGAEAPINSLGISTLANDTQLTRRRDIAAALLEMAEVDAATELLKQILERAPEDKSAQLLLVRALLQAGEHAQARAVAELLAERNPQDAMALSALAGALAADGDATTARQLYEQAASLDPASAAPLAGLGLIALNEGELDKAAELVERASALGPNEPVVATLTALIERPRLAEHQRRLAAAVQANPTMLFARLELAGLLMEQGDAAQAADLLSNAPEAQQRKPRLSRRLAAAQLAAGRPDEVLITLQQLPPEQLEDAGLRWLRAQANALAGRVEPLIDDLQSLDAAPARSTEAPSLAQLVGLVDSLRHAEKRRQLREALANATPQSSLVGYLQARDAFQAGAYAKAASEFSKLRRQHPDVPVLLLGEAAALEADGQQPKAWQVMEQWLDAHPRQTRVRLALADSYRRAADTDKAVAHYRAVVNADPRDAVARNNLAMLLKDDAPDEALVLARQAVALLPRNPQMADTLGQVLLRHEETAAAVSVLRSAYRRSQDADIGRRYARALASAGDTAEAAKMLRRIESPAPAAD
jgi:putative PEP-CTERM system TPR-repeat lipoprotein